MTEVKFLLSGIKRVYYKYSQVALGIKNPSANAGDTGDAISIPAGGEDPLEEEMATRSSILVWKIPRAEEPGVPQSMGLQRVGHD